jgi:hypothetical protein
LVAVFPRPQNWPFTDNEIRSAWLNMWITYGDTIREEVNDGAPCCASPGQQVDPLSNPLHRLLDQQRRKRTRHQRDGESEETLAPEAQGQA